MAKKVMVIDDEQETLNYIEMGLEMCGYDVLTISNSLHAIDLAQTMVPDVIVLDFMMPGLDGLDIYNGLNASDITKKIPIIFITALTVPEVTERILKTKAFCYISKPFEISALTDRISEALSSKPDTTHDGR